MEDVNLHAVKLEEDGTILLDGKKLNGVVSFEIRKSSAVAPTELVMKLIVKDQYSL